MFKVFIKIFIKFVLAALIMTFFMTFMTFVKSNIYDDWYFRLPFDEGIYLFLTVFWFVLFPGAVVITSSLYCFWHFGKLAFSRFKNPLRPFIFSLLTIPLCFMVAAMICVVGIGRTSNGNYLVEKAIAMSNDYQSDSDQFDGFKSNMKVYISGIHNLFSANPTLEYVKFVNEKGVWLELKDINIFWWIEDIFHPKLVIDKLGIKNVKFIRDSLTGRGHGRGRGRGRGRRHDYKNEKSNWRFGLKVKYLHVDLIDIKDKSLGKSLKLQLKVNNFKSGYHNDGIYLQHLLLSRVDEKNAYIDVKSVSYSPNFGLTSAMLDIFEGPNGIFFNKIGAVNKPEIRLQTRLWSQEDELKGALTVKVANNQIVTGDFKLPMLKQGEDFKQISLRLKGKLAPLLEKQFKPLLADETVLDFVLNKKRKKFTINGKIKSASLNLTSEGIINLDGKTKIKTNIKFAPPNGELLIHDLQQKLTVKDFNVVSYMEGNNNNLDLSLKANFEEIGYGINSIEKANINLNATGISSNGDGKFDLELVADDINHEFTKPGKLLNGKFHLTAKGELKDRNLEASIIDIQAAGIKTTATLKAYIYKFWMLSSWDVSGKIDSQIEYDKLPNSIASRFTEDIAMSVRFSGNAKNINVESAKLYSNDYDLALSGILSYEFLDIVVKGHLKNMMLLHPSINGFSSFHASVKGKIDKLNIELVSDEADFSINNNLVDNFVISVAADVYKRKIIANLQIGALLDGKDFHGALKVEVKPEGIKIIKIKNINFIYGASYLRGKGELELGQHILPNGVFELHLPDLKEIQPFFISPVQGSIQLDLIADKFLKKKTPKLI